MARMVEFFYDLADPGCHLAAARIEDLVARKGAVLAWRPILAGEVAALAGAEPPSEAEARWIGTDLARWAARWGVDLAPNLHAPLDTTTAMRMLMAAEERGHQVPLLRRLFRGAWVEGADLGDEQVLVSLAREAGVPGPHLLERTRSGHVRERLEGNVREAVRRGAFGVPTFFVGPAMFHGHDRLDFLEEALDAA